MSQRRRNIGDIKLRKNAGRRLSQCGKLSMDMILLPPDFREFLQLLNSHNVRYLLIGGYAVGYYGYPRATAYMDIWIATDTENIAKVIVALAEFGFAEVEPEIFAKEKQVLRMGVPPLRIKLLTGVSGVDFEECYSARTAANLDGVEINLIGLEHLKVNKMASGRYKDLNDLEHLP
jgi:predicted nucleotidyltransferase